MHPITSAKLKTQIQGELNIGLDKIRFQRGRVIVDKKNQIQELDKFQYKVKSQSTCVAYEVLSTEQGWVCSCADHKFRGVICKHLYAIFCVLNRGQEAESDACNRNRREKELVEL